MSTTDILTLIGGLMLTIIGYFLKRTMDELKEVKETTIDTRSKLAVLENDYINKVQSLNEKFDDLDDGIRELTKEIKELNKRINEKH